MRDDHHALKELQNIMNLNKENIKNSKLYRILRRSLKSARLENVFFNHLLKSDLEVRLATPNGIRYSLIAVEQRIQESFGVCRNCCRIGCSS